MHSEEQAQREFDQEVVQQASMAIYPQLCGSWPGDEWPGDELMRPRGAFVDLCSGLSSEYVGEGDTGFLENPPI